MLKNEEAVESKIIMPNESEWAKAQRSSCISPDLDLISAAIAQIRFLRAVDNTPALLDPEVLERAVDRYFENWLPLVSEFVDSSDFKHSLNCYLQPPLDCAWIWHCHKLRPEQYFNDCQNIFQKLLDVNFLPGMEPQDSKLRVWADNYSRRRWEARFPDESYDFVLPFEDGNSTEFQNLLMEKRSSRINPGRLRHDLVTAAQRNSAFYYQVSSKWFWDQKFLETALMRYKGFLYLIKEKSGELFPEPARKLFFVPTYDIDLLWHSHQLAPSAYNKDIMSFLGRMLDHDDTEHDRSVGQNLSNAFEDTCDLWLKVYNKVYEQAGAMYRGPPPLPVPAIPILTDDDNERLLSFTTEGKWNTESFKTAMKAERNFLRHDSNDLRQIMEVNLIVMGAKNVPQSSDPTTINQTYVRVTALAKCPILEVKTCMKQLEKKYDDVQWNEALCMEMDLETKGLRLQLMRSKFRLRRSKIATLQRSVTCFGSSKKQVVDEEDPEEVILDPFGADEVIGQLDINWTDIRRSRSGLASTRLSPIQYTRYGSQSSAPLPYLRYHVSITAPTAGPRLFRCIQSPVTDDNCQIVSLRVKDAPGMRLKMSQAGRWITKIVVNHVGKEKFVVRTRSNSDSNHGKSVELKGKEMVEEPKSEALINVYDGEYKDFQKGNILGSARELMESEFPIGNKDNVRYWSLFDDTGILAVHRPTATRGLKVKIYGELGEYRLRLVPGARLQFEEPNDTQTTASSVTLVRYTPELPRGGSTALINLKTSTIAVMPQESVVLVLLISSAIYRSLYDFDAKLAIDPSINWRVRNTTLPKLGTSSESDNGGIMGSVVLQNRGLSSRWSMMCPREERPKLLYDRWNINCGHEMTGTLCCAAACSGAACGGTTSSGGVGSGSASGNSYSSSRAGGSRGGSIRGDYSVDLDRGVAHGFGFGDEGRG